MPVRALIKIRVSTQDQTLEEQEKRAIHYAINEYGYRRDELKVFAEVFSGTSKQLPGTLSMMEYAQKHAHEVERVIIADIDRLTRAGVTSYEEIKARLMQLGIELVDIHGVIQPTRNHLAGIGEGFGKDLEYSWSVFSPSEGEEVLRAQYAKAEHRNILLRTIGKEIENTKNGYESREAGYGFKNIKVLDEHGKLIPTCEPDPVEAGFVRKMYERRVSGVSDSESCRLLNQDGFVSRTRYSWGKDHRGNKVCTGTFGAIPITPTTLRRHIRKVRYAGFKCEKWTWRKLIRAKHEPLVSIELWNKANEGYMKIVPSLQEPGEYLLINEQKQKRHYRKNNPDFPYKHVLTCPECGKKVKAAYSRSCSGKRYPFYFCNRSHKQVSVTPKDIVDFLDAQLRGIKFTESTVQFFIDRLEQIWQQRNHYRQIQRAQQEAKATKLKQEANRLVDVISRLSVPELITQTENRYKQIQSEIAALQAKQQEQEAITEEQFKQYLAFCKSFIERLDEWLVNSDDHRILELSWDMIFKGTVSIENILGRTPEYSALIRRKGALEKRENDVVPFSDKESNILYEEFIRWSKCIDRIYTIWRSGGKN